MRDMFGGIALLTEAALDAADCVLTVGEIHEAVAQAWYEIRSGAARGGKAVLSLPEEEFWALSDYAPFRPDFSEERLGWKLSSLYGVSSTHGGVKIIGANAFNRTLGLPRSTSTYILLDKFTLRPVAILDETALSAERTGTYASLVAEQCLTQGAAASVFVVGAGPVAKSVIRSLAYSCGDRIEQIFIRARKLESARALAIALYPEVTIPLVPVDTVRPMRQCSLVVTASNAREPVFADEDLAPEATTLHLGGNEAPETYLQRVLRSGLMVCDDLQTVSRRNSQSIALHFSRRGLSLEAIGPLIGIRELAGPQPWWDGAGGPVCITCVGLPVLDLFVAKASFDKYCRATTGREVDVRCFV